MRAFPGAGLVLVVALSGCFVPPTPRTTLQETARELNESARFGRMELAASHADPAVRADFLERRASWGDQIRIVDAAFAGIELDADAGRAVVQIDLSWIRIDESHLRTTRIAQTWREREGKWALTREQRISGDEGIFGEPVEPLNEPHPDVQFETRVIR